MAGGKETPRQKLIGLMYLVLLALLALQVSSAIMEKFKFLDESLQFSNDAMDEDNTRLEKSIAKAVADNGNKSTDKVVLDKALEVTKEAHEIKIYIENLRNEIITQTDGLEEDGSWKGAKEETKVEVFMIGSKNGKGYELQKKINGFCDYLTGLKLTEGDDPSAKVRVFSHIAMDAKDDDRIKSKEQKNKDFAELNFGQTPMCAAMAVMSVIEAEVLKYETDALNLLYSKLGATDIKFDKVFATYSSDSKVVAAGTKYVASLFLTAASSGLQSKISVDGRSLEVDKDGRGKLEFTATGGSYDKDGLAKKSWTGTIAFKNKGKDTAFIVKGEYIVAQPVIQIQSGAVSALYMNCGNQLIVNVPALGSIYNPSFQAVGADVQPGSKKGEVLVIPNSKNVTLKVSSGGNYIGSQEFQVKGIPKPEITYISNGRPVDLKNGFKTAAPKSLQVKAIPLPEFAASNPKDARYKVTQWTAFLLRGSRLVKEKTLTSEVADLNELSLLSKPGDRIVVEIKQVLRSNFYDKTEEVRLSQTITTIPITD